MALGARAISQRRSASQTNRRIVSSGDGISRLENPRRTENQARSEGNRQVNRGASPQPIERGPGREPGIRAATTPTTSTEAGPQTRGGSAQPTNAATLLAEAFAAPPASRTAAFAPRKESAPAVAIEAAQSEEVFDPTVEHDPYRHALHTGIAKIKETIAQAETRLPLPSPQGSLEALVNSVVDYRNKPLQECEGKLAKSFKRIWNMKTRLQHIRNGATEPMVQQGWQPSYIQGIREVLEKHQNDPEACLSRLRKKLRRRAGEESDHPGADSDIWLYVRVIRERITNPKDLEHYLATCIQPIGGHGEGRQALARPLLIPSQQDRRGGAAGSRAVGDLYSDMRAAPTRTAGPVDPVANQLTRDRAGVPRSQSLDDDNRVAGPCPSDNNPAGGLLPGQRSHQSPALDNRQRNLPPTQQNGWDFTSYQATSEQSYRETLSDRLMASLRSSAGGAAAAGPSDGPLGGHSGVPSGGPSGGPSRGPAGGPSVDPLPAAPSAGAAAVFEMDYGCARARAWKHRPGAPWAGEFSPGDSTPPAGRTSPAANTSGAGRTPLTGSGDPPRNSRSATNSPVISDVPVLDPRSSRDTTDELSRHVRARYDNGGGGGGARAPAIAATAGAGAAAVLPGTLNGGAATAPTTASSDSLALSLRPGPRSRKRKAPERVVK